MNAPRFRISLQMLFFLTVVGLGVAGKTQTPSPDFCLSGPCGTLTLDMKGLSLAPQDQACPAIAAQGGPLWTIVLQKPATPPVVGEKRILSALGQEPRREVTADALRLVYESLTDGNRTWKIGLTLEIRRKGEAFEIGGELRNDEKGWIVRELTGPVLSGIQADPAAYSLLWPNGVGQRFRGAGPATSHSFIYPSAFGSMQWCAVTGARAGLYLGCHDATHGMKTYAVRYDPKHQKYNLAITHLPFCADGRRWVLPPLVILPYGGSWHAGARCYRAWFDSVDRLCSSPPWARDASGWLLCILKQQNGEVMWDYASLEKLCDVADQRGLDILGLFGWARGGHDRLHPDSIPDPRMGGEDALRRALQQVHRRGKRVILYANGRRMDAAGEYIRTHGRDVTLLMENGKASSGVVRKFNSSSAVTFILACNGAKGWFEKMLALAIRAHELGADGILYDELATQAPVACFASNHDHANPSLAYTTCRRDMLQRITEHMKAIAPDFIVMSEGIHDSILDSISLFHGWGLGLWSPAQARGRLGPPVATTAYPEMFRFTFPEVPITVRHATPMMDRATVNYTCVYGLRYELESRYGPDARYLKDAVVPAPEAYRDNPAPPDGVMMRATAPAEAARYLKQVIDFQRTHIDLLRRGRFVDDQGFKFEGKLMVAKGFAAGDRLGVLVWNPTDKPGSFTLAVPGASLLSAAEPGRASVEAFGELAPQSLRLLVWRKTGDQP